MFSILFIMGKKQLLIQVVLSIPLGIWSLLLLMGFLLWFFPCLKSLGYYVETDKFAILIN